MTEQAHALERAVGADEATEPADCADDACGASSKVIPFPSARRVRPSKPPRKPRGPGSKGAA
jgi:hypothetical protein